MNVFRSRMSKPVGGLVAVALLISACSSDDSGGDDTAGEAATANPELLGPSRPATGEALTIGFITDGQSATVDGRPEVTAARAAVDYVNGHLGGVAGRPLELDVCETHLTPAGATDCANQMIADDVPIVLQVAPGVAEPIVTALDEAQIPYFVDAAIDQSILLSPNSYVLTNTLGGLAAPVKVAEDNEVEKVAALLIDVPTAVGPIRSLGGPLFEQAGVAVDFVPVPPGTPDMTPQVQQALGDGADMFNIIGDPTFCVSALGALNTLGFDGIRLVNPQCLGADMAENVSGGIDGVQVATTESLDASDPEVALYEAVLAQYAEEDIEPHLSTTSGGYAIVVGFARAMSGLTGNVTPDTVRSSMASMSPQPLPLLDGQTFQCDRSLFTLTPAVCSSGIAIVTLDADGNPTDTEAFDTAPIING
jgi:branched-chain amino acid transport system substrate-binding protein